MTTDMGNYPYQQSSPFSKYPVAEFEKVSLEEYISSQKTDDPKAIEAAKEEWNHIVMPERATGWSAGYDFHLPYNVCFSAHEPVTIPTGIRVKMNPNWVLFIVPRSGLGFKYHMQLENTVGIIDADYYYADNEGHIMVRVRCGKPLSMRQGDRFVQGIFLPFGVAEEYMGKATRKGGMGSTGVQ